MDKVWKSTVILIFGSLPILFAEHLEHRGFASNLSIAQEVCEELNETLITAENDENRKIVTTFLQENKLDSAWLHANFMMLRNWSFTDGNQTILSDSEIDDTQGGFCGAFTAEGSSLFKSLPCTESLPTLLNKKECELLCHKEDSSHKNWYTLNKTKLATPQKEDFRGFQDLKKIKGGDITSGLPSFWIGLRKFKFSWPDGKEIPLNQWEDNSTFTGDCLILKNDGKMAVVDCKSSYIHSVLCFTGEDSNLDPLLKKIILALGVVCAILLLVACCLLFSCEKDSTSNPEITVIAEMKVRHQQRATTAENQHVPIPAENQQVEIPAGNQIEIPAGNQNAEIPAANLQGHDQQGKPVPTYEEIPVIKIN